VEEHVVKMVDNPGEAFSGRSLRDAEDVAEDQVDEFSPK